MGCVAKPRIYFKLGFLKSAGICLKMNRKRLEAYRRLESEAGNTPLYEITHVRIPNGNRILAKEEYKNPTGSSFDRLYPFLFRVAEESGIIRPSITPVIEQSGGNAGASFAWCASRLGYQDCAVIVLPNTPKSRIQHIESFGARVVISKEGGHVKGNIQLLERMLHDDRARKGGRISRNPQRLYCITKTHPLAHLSPGYERLVDEVRMDSEKLGVGGIDYFICGIGSGTTLKGIGTRLVEHCPEVRLVGVEPQNMPTVKMALEHRQPETTANMDTNYQLFGLGTGLPPEKLNIPYGLIDDISLVPDEGWRAAYKMLSEKEGKGGVGRVSAAVFSAALQIAEAVSNKTILVLFSDPIWKFSENYQGFK